MPAYYLIMIGGSLTLVSSVIILIGGAYNAYYSRFYAIFADLNQITAFALTLMPGLAIIYLGQRFLRKPESQLPLGIAVAIVSLVSLFGIIGSGVFVAIGILNSGPPISFAGGITGAFLVRTGSSTVQPPNAVVM